MATNCALTKVLFFIPFFSSINCYITWIEPRLPLKGNAAKPGTPWPLPQKWIQSENVLKLDQFHFSIILNFSNECDVLREGIKRYQKLMFLGAKKLENSSTKEFTKGSGHKMPLLSLISLFVTNSSCFYPQQSDDESYNITLSGKTQGLIVANTVWGALHALETVSQLIYQDTTTKDHVVNETVIEDWPAYSYRGLLVDTARHFIPVSLLTRNLEAMAYNKMNVFHWHLVDDQSFPYESKTFPKLSKNGAFSEKHVYSQNDVKSIVEFARMRGIRVIPEIDSPGHTKSIGKGYPNLLTTCYGNDGKPFVSSYPLHSESEVLNPINEDVYSFMSDLFKEVKHLFPEKYIHLGMDEVNYGCWKSNPDIQEFMVDNLLVNISQLEQYYVRRLIDDVKSIGYKYVIWQDPIDNGVEAEADTIVQIWKDTSLDSSLNLWRNYAKSIASKGYRVIVSACWYLNYINYPYPGNDWEKFYECDPRNFTTSEELKNLVLGGEACLWTEFVDGTNFLSRLWPRASAVAERLWTNPKNFDEGGTRFRLDQQRCRLVHRMIPAAPILNGFCGDYDWQL